METHDWVRVGVMFGLFFAGQTIAIIIAMWRFASRTETRLAVVEAHITTIYNTVTGTLTRRVEKVEDRLAGIRKDGGGS